MPIANFTPLWKANTAPERILGTKWHFSSSSVLITLLFSSLPLFLSLSLPLCSSHGNCQYSRKPCVNFHLTVNLTASIINSKPGQSLVWMGYWSLSSSLRAAPAMNLAKRECKERGWEGWAAKREKSRYCLVSFLIPLSLLHCSVFCVSFQKCSVWLAACHRSVTT